MLLSLRLFRGAGSSSTPSTRRRTVRHRFVTGKCGSGRCWDERRRIRQRWATSHDSDTWIDGSMSILPIDESLWRSSTVHHARIHPSCQSPSKQSILSLLFVRCSFHIDLQFTWTYQTSLQRYTDSTRPVSGHGTCERVIHWIRRFAHDISIVASYFEFSYYDVFSPTVGVFFSIILL